MLKQNPEVGQPTNWPDVRSVQTSSHIRIFYRIAGNKVIILNQFSLKMNPVKRPFQ